MLQFLIFTQDHTLNLEEQLLLWPPTISAASVVMVRSTLCYFPVAPTAAISDVGVAGSPEFDEFEGHHREFIAGKPFTRYVMQSFGRLQASQFSKQSQRGRHSNVYEMAFSRGRSWSGGSNSSNDGLSPAGENDSILMT